MTVQKLTKALVLFSIIGLMAACQQAYTLVSAQKPVKVGESVVLNPTSDWSRLGDGSSQNWTIDGRLLHEIVLSTDIGYGDPLLRIQAEQNVPVYAENTSPIDLVDSFAASLKAYGMEEVTITSSDVVTLNGEKALQVEYTARSGTAPEYLGIAYLVDLKGVLHLATYYGTKLFHYEKQRAEFINMMNQATWRKVT